jgi:hypothetical protein
MDYKDDLQAKYEHFTREVWKLYNDVCKERDYYFWWAVFWAVCSLLLSTFHLVDLWKKYF